VTTPLGQAMSENEAVIAKSQQVLKEIVAQKPLRPRGIL
jgi:hypothetical protein